MELKLKVFDHGRPTVTWAEVAAGSMRRGGLMPGEKSDVTAHSGEDPPEGRGEEVDETTARSTTLWKIMIHEQASK